MGARVPNYRLDKSSVLVQILPPADRSLRKAAAAVYSLKTQLERKEKKKVSLLFLPLLLALL